MKIQIVVASLSLVASLGLITEGCKGALGNPTWPLTCGQEAADLPCAACIRASCCGEATACGGDARCECLTNCQKDERRDTAPGHFASEYYQCLKACESSPRTNPPFKALAACVDAHCANLCVASGGNADAGTPKGTSSP